MARQTSELDSSKLDTDLLILDCLLYKATQRLLSEIDARVNGSATSKTKADNALSCTSSFLTIFRKLHPHHVASDELKLRLELCKYVTFFARRGVSDVTTPTADQVAELRLINTARAHRWRAAVSLPSLHVQSLQPVPDHPTHGSLFLLDLLPGFMRLSATCSQGLDATRGWMELACAFMLQATIEQSGNPSSDLKTAREEAFAWGYASPQDFLREAPGLDQGAVDEALAINALFADHEGETPKEADAWKDVKTASQEILEDIGDDPEKLDGVRETHPVEEFESQLLSFLSSISRLIATPILVQLDDGTLRSAALRKRSPKVS